MKGLPIIIGCDSFISFFVTVYMTAQRKEGKRKYFQQQRSETVKASHNSLLQYLV